MLEVEGLTLSICMLNWGAGVVVLVLFRLNMFFWEPAISSNVEVGVPSYWTFIRGEPSTTICGSSSSSINIDPLFYPLPDAMR